MRDVNWLEELVSAITREMSWFRKKKSSYLCLLFTHTQDAKKCWVLMHVV